MSRRIKFVSHFAQKLFQWFMHKMIERKRTDAWRRMRKPRKFFNLFFFLLRFLGPISHASIERIIPTTTVINLVYVCLLLLLMVSAGPFLLMFLLFFFPIFFFAVGLLVDHTWCVVFLLSTSPCKFYLLATLLCAVFYLRQ